MNYTEFAQKIKVKYPEYQEMDDLELSRKVVSKYPEYKDVVEFGQPIPTEVPESKPTELPLNESETPKGTPVNVGLAQSAFLGTSFGTAPLIAGGADVARNLAKKVVPAKLPEFLQKQKDLVLGTDNKNIGESFKGGRERFLESQQQYAKQAPVASTLAEVGGGFALPIGSLGGVAKGLSVLDKIKKSAKVGAILGGTYGAGTGLSQTKDKILDPEMAAKGATFGGTIGLVSGGLGSAIPQGIKKLITSKDIGRKLDYIVPSGTQKKTIENIIENPKVQKEAVKKGFNMNYDIYLNDASKRIENLTDDVNKIIKDAYKDIPDTTKIDLTKTNAFGKMQNAFKEYVDNTDLLPNTTVLKETEEILNNLQNKLSKNKSSAEDFVNNKIGTKIRIGNTDTVLGKEVDFIGKNATVQTDIRETPTEIYLNIINTKKTGDMGTVLKKTGKGTEVINSLKEYADKTGKKLIIPDATNKAYPFWKKFNWLDEDYGVKIKLEDGQIYNPPNTFSYTPKPTKTNINGNIDFRNLKEMTSFLNERADKFARDGDYTTAKMYNKMRSALAEARDQIPKIAKATELYHNTKTAKEILEKSLGVKLDNPKNASSAILSNFRDNKGSYVTEQVEEAVNILKNHPETKHLADITDKMKLAQTSYDLRPKDESKMLSEISKSRGLTMLDLVLKLVPKRDSSEKARNLARRLSSGQITKEQLAEPFNLIGSPLFEESINKLIQGQKAYGGKLSTVGKGIEKIKLGTYTLPRITIKELLKEKE